MNNVVLVGRLVNAPELKYVGEFNNAVTNFRLAVSRGYKTKDGVVESDFINIEVWGKKAEIYSRYLQKGSLVAVSGSLRTESYQTSEGENKYITKIRANNLRFLDNKKSDEQKYYSSSQIFTDNSNIEITEEISEDEIPF